MAQALGIAYASGLNLYATVALLGIADRAGWIGSLPGGLDAVARPWVIAIMLVLALVEFLATLVPGLASAWEAVHTAIRAPAAALLAGSAVAGSEPGLPLVAGLLGGGLALTVNGTKLGLQMAVDTSPEPVTNGLVNAAGLGFVTGLLALLDRHPWVALTAALAVLAAAIALVLALRRAIRRRFPPVGTSAARG